MDLIFAGTPDFAVPTLEALLAAGHAVRAVYTQPDRPAGRGRQLSASPVKRCALAHGLTVRQPATLKTAEAAEELRALAPDAMIVVAYGLILPQAILDIPRLGCLNVHASLLPRWRGAAPIQRALEAGDAVTGVTIMKMEAGLDTGPMLARVETAISADDSAQTLHDRLAQLGAGALVETLAQLAAGGLDAQAQDASQVCYAAKLSKAEALIDWRQPAAMLHRKIRALNPWPVASTTLDGATLRLWEVAPTLAPELSADTRPAAADTALAAPGTVLAAGPDGVRVQTGAGVLTVTRLQAEGGRPLPVSDFLNGHALPPGSRLGA